MLLSIALVRGPGFWEISVDAIGIDIVEELLDDADEGEDESSDASATVGRMVGRLGDLAVSWVLSAQSSVDSVINPDASAALSIMSSSMLQAGAVRLWTLPPPHIPEVDCRRNVTALITQSLQQLPQTHHIDAGLCEPMQEAHLSAHAHVLHAELLLELRSATEKPQQRQQRLAWHIERARLSLHNACSTSAVACVLLMRLHLIQARLLMQSNSSSKRQAEQALDELVNACRAGRDMRKAEEAIPIQAALGECCKLVLQQLQVVLRTLCTRETAQRQEKSSELNARCWKGLYRAALQFSHAEIENVPPLYDAVLEPGN
jgi:hypothetical protein